ncbi:MAG TPA: hypothetical protein VKE70_26985 [Candidatus Solibacter sp.]|nr:hypothetical protein [Candidatus Solibacter sp.]
MNLTRRAFLATSAAIAAAQGTLDRRAIVRRHNPTLRAFDPRSPLSVGNGELCFTADCTGLQTFPHLYEKDLTLSTMSQRGWQTSPNRPPGELRFTEYDTYGRMVGYPTSSTGQAVLFNWLRENPHRANLGHIGFAIERPEDVQVIQQTLDLWTGILHSEFKWQGKHVTVAMCCHPTQNAIAYRVQGAEIPVVKSGDIAVLPFDATSKASIEHWQRFWSTGAAIDLSASPELERRVVRSQYLTAIQCAGSLPPQETGLTCHSWFGKFHLEMHFWHAAHFAHWRRPELLARSLDYYIDILPSAREKARSQGYIGARWPKMTDPSGTDSPSNIGPLLIWQQPHPIVLCELAGRSDKYRAVVFESADFMADFAHYDAKRDRYVLGPPVIPAQENHPPRETWNPTFELEQWDYALEIAQQWRLRAGMERNAKWDDVRNKLSALPVGDGVYLAHENCPQTFTERNRDHPSMLGALGVLPGRKVDRETMRRTLKRVFAEWKWEDTWGWDFPMVAMTAASLGERKLAIDVLMMKTPKNTWLPNGHNYQRPNLPCYLPGNGGLLLAIAHMVRAKSFPKEWRVRAEGFAAL